MPIYNSTLHITTWLKGVLPYLCNEMGAVPTIKLLATMKGCSKASMHKAIKKLEAEGLLVSKRGYGTCLKNYNSHKPDEPKIKFQEILKNIHSDKDKPLFVLVLPFYSYNNPNHSTIPFYLSDFCVGVFNACEKLNIEIVIKFLDTYLPKRGKSIREILSYLKKNPVKGIMTGSVVDRPFFQDLSRLGLPTLIVDHWPLGMNLPSLNPNHSDATKELVFVLASLKHKNIALINRIDPGLNPEIESGYKAGLLATQIDFKSELIFNMTASFFARQEQLINFEKIMTSVNRPTAFIIHSSSVAIELVKFLCRIGIKIPNDVSIVTFCANKVEINGVVLSGIFYDWAKIGSLSVTKLLAHSNKKNEFVFNDTFKFSFLSGSSISHNSNKA